MLDAAMPGEVEDRLLAEARGIKIAIMHQHAVILVAELGDNKAVGIDDHGPAHQMVPVLAARLGYGDDPGRVLVGAGL